MSIKTDHKGRGQKPWQVDLCPTVFCRQVPPPWGVPYYQRQYMEVAYEFADGEEIVNWNDGGWFEMNGHHYQVVSGSGHIDIVLRRPFEELMEMIRKEVG